MSQLDPPSGAPARYAPDLDGPPSQSGPPGQHVTVPPTNAKALIAFVTAFSFPILAVIFGVKARREIDRTGEAGRVYANWGLGLGIAWCVLVALYIVVVVVVIIAGIGETSEFGGA